jgi:hypothetical protein
MEMTGLVTSKMDQLRDTERPGQTGDERQDRLEYLADLLGELQQMAEREGCRRLSRMLALSYAEAIRETFRRSA